MYKIRVTVFDSDNGCTFYDEGFVRVIGTPTIDAGPDQQVCNASIFSHVFNMNAIPTISGMNSNGLASWWSLLMPDTANNDTSEWIFPNCAIPDSGQHQGKVSSLSLTHPYDCPNLGYFGASNSDPHMPGARFEVFQYGCYDFVWHVIDPCTLDTLVDTVQLCWSFEEPVVNAGPDIFPDCNTVQLQGNTSAASAANYGCFRWRQVGGPANITLLDSLNNIAFAESLDTLPLGTYQFEYRLGCHPCYYYDTMAIIISAPISSSNVSLTVDTSNLCNPDSATFTASGGSQYAFF